MALAIEEAKKCEPEPGRDPGSPTPMVGAVVVDAKGNVLGKAYRGENKPGEHAEYTLLEGKLKHATLAGLTLYTTLEPCTARNHPKKACVDRVIRRKFKRVVIGTLDPNRTVLGLGVKKLRHANIAVELFDNDLMSKYEEINRDFIDSHDNPQLKTAMANTIGQIQPHNRVAVRPKPALHAVSVPKSDSSNKTSSWSKAAVYPEPTPFEEEVGLSSDSRAEHEHRREIAAELRDLKKYLDSGRQEQGEVLAAFVVNSDNNHELRKELFDSQVNAYATMNALHGPIGALVNAGILTYDDDDRIIGLGTKHATALEMLCEFFKSGDYQEAKKVLRAGRWDSVIPQGL